MLLGSHLAARDSCVVLDGPTSHDNTGRQRRTIPRTETFLVDLFIVQPAGRNNNCGLCVSNMPMIPYFHFCFGGAKKGIKTISVNHASSEQSTAGGGDR
jgi:hypothetical protein